MSACNIRVALRSRPLVQSQPETWKIIAKNTITQVDETGATFGDEYTFDHIFDQHQSNADIYYGCVQEFTASAIGGLNTTVFAYGQTSSGKTHTMMGGKGEQGLLQLAVEEIFRSVAEMGERKFLLRVSFIEIYTERLFDLLEPSKVVNIRDSVEGTVHADMHAEIVATPAQVYALLDKGNNNRHIGQTNMNERSSRSHAIFRIVIESTVGENFDKSAAVQFSCLNFVDLAGSERLAHSKAEGERLREGTNINKSLSVLSLVINQLSESKEFVNYRDSKLTRLLKDSLGGNAKTLIIATITTTSTDYTLSTVKFAQRAKGVKNKPKINQIIDKEKMMKEYQSTNKQLMQELEHVQLENATLKDANLQYEKEQRLKQQISSLELFYKGPSMVSMAKRRHTIAPGALDAIKRVKNEDIDEEKSSIDWLAASDRRWSNFTNIEDTIPEFEDMDKDFTFSESKDVLERELKLKIDDLKEELRDNEVVNDKFITSLQNEIKNLFDNLSVLYATIESDSDVDIIKTATDLVKKEVIEQMGLSEQSLNDNFSEVGGIREYIQALALHLTKDKQTVKNLTDFVIKNTENVTLFHKKIKDVIENMNETLDIDAIGQLKGFDEWFTENEEFDFLKNTLQNEELSLRSVSSLICDLIIKYKESVSKNGDYRKQIKNLKSDFENMNMEQKAEKELIQEDNQSKIIEIESLKSQIHDLYEQFNSFKSNFDDELNTNNEKILLLEEANNDLSNTVNLQALDLANEREKYKEMESKFHEISENLSQHKHAYQSKLDAEYEEKIKAERTKIDELEANTKNLTEKLKKIEFQFEGVLQELNHCNELNDESEKRANLESTKILELQEANKKLEERESALRRLQEELDQKQCNNCPKLNNELKESKSKLKEINREKDVLLTTIKKLENDLTINSRILEREEREKEKERVIVTQLKKELFDKETALERLELEAKQNKCEKCAKLKTELNTAQRVEFLLRKDLLKMELWRDQQQKEMDNLRKNNDLLTYYEERHEKQKKEIADLKANGSMDPKYELLLAKYEKMKSLCRLRNQENEALKGRLLNK